MTNTNKSDIIIKDKRAQRNAYSITQKQIGDICNNELKSIRFPAKVKYNSRIMDNGKTIAEVYPWGDIKAIKEIQIGKQDKDTNEFLIDSILHEKLEAKIASINTNKYQKLKKDTDENRHKYIDQVITRYFNLKGGIMEIDDILEIFFDGEKEEIEKILKSQKISYSFTEDLQAYTIKNNDTLEVVRGNKCHYTPNCVKYFGNKYE